MTTLPGTVLERGRVLPGVAFDAGDGSTWTPWDLRGRSGVVLAFLHEGCGPCEAWSEEIASLDLGAVDARAFAVLEREGRSPLPVLVDREGQAASRLLAPGAERPTVVIADRYAAAWEAYPVVGHDLPSADEIVATLRHAAITCADCAAPAWGD